MRGSTYTYRALDSERAEVAGDVSASSSAEAYRLVAARGLVPLSIESGASQRKTGGRGRPKRRDVAQFTYQLSALVGSGIPLYQGLRAMAEQEPRAGIRAMIGDIARRIGEGQRLSEAIAAHERVFGEVYTSTLRSAEESGNLGSVLEYLSDMFEGLDETRQQMRSALIYPVCVVTVLVLAVALVLALVLPRFATIFAERGAELPLLTRVLVGVGESLAGYWWAYLSAVGALAIGLRSSASDARMRLRMDGVVHAMPGMRGLLVNMAVGRFARVLGLCLGSGLSLIESLELAGSASGRPRLDREARRMGSAIREGKRLHEALETCEYLTPFAQRMLRAGEEAGELPRMCGLVARYHERAAGSLLKNLSAVLEPLLIVLIATVVLFIALAIFLPMWGMLSLVGG